MTQSKRQRIKPPNQWEQLELLFTSPEQRRYELIWPVVLFGQPAADRAREMNSAQRAVARHARQFLQHGMANLPSMEPAPRRPRLPTEIREAIIALKAEHPPLHCANLLRSVHWANRLPDDGRESPAEVLDWVVGRVWTPEALDYAFNALRFSRRLDRIGYLQFRHWRMYAEPGLEQQRVAVWLYKEQLTIEFNDTQLAHYTVEYQPDGRHFRALTDPQIDARSTVRHSSPCAVR